MFNATLLREKFVIMDAMPEKAEDSEPIVAMSNRVILPLISPSGQIQEDFAIRAQNMHTAVRFAAILTRSFHEKGPLLRRRQPFQWEHAYQDVTEGYEKKWNPERWLSVYHKGRVLYENGEADRHIFLDIIEQCDARNKGSYDRSLEIAKDCFQQAGKLVSIKYDSNVAMIVNATQEVGKVGVIARGPDKKTTFNFTARKQQDRFVKASQCLSIGAAFLEGIQLAFYVGMTNTKLKYDLIDPQSEEAKKGKDAFSKLGRLNTAISNFEMMFDVSYRPERPGFWQMVDEAEEFAKRLYTDDISDKIDSNLAEDVE